MRQEETAKKTSPIVVMEKAGRSFGARVVLSGLDLTVSSGEMVGVVQRGSIYISHDPQSDLGLFGAAAFGEIQAVAIVLAGGPPAVS